MKLDPTTIRVVAFDCCKTVFDMAGVPQHEMEDYIAQVRRPEWAPLTLPPDWWCLPAHEDAAEGINRISSGGFMCVTLSNWPSELLAVLSISEDIKWDAIIPMESRRVYKPDPSAYINIPMVMNRGPSQVLVVTANETAPDIETARSLGMQAILIDRERKYADGPKTIIELAEMLGC